MGYKLPTVDDTVAVKQSNLCNPNVLLKFRRSLHDRFHIFVHNPYQISFLEIKMPHVILDAEQCRHGLQCKQSCKCPGVCGFPRDHIKPMHGGSTTSCRTHYDSMV